MAKKTDHYVERVTRSLARAAIISAHKTQQLTKKRYRPGKRAKQDFILFFSPLKTRIAVGFAVLLILLAEFTPVFNVFLDQKVYAFEDPQQLLPKSSQALADKLQLDTKQQIFNFNAGYSPGTNGDVKSAGPKISAVAHVDPKLGVKVTDPVNQTEFGLKPKFLLKDGEKRDNKVVYPLQDGTGWLVYSMQADQVKEDVLLRYAKGDKMKFDYELDFGVALEAHLEKDGSIGVYGTSLPINGNVTAGSDKDAELLQKARQNAKKDKLMFTIPAPVIKETNKTKSDIRSYYQLDGKNLTLKVEGLRKGSYPLTIDPSVYVTSAEQFMYGNNDSNIDFNVGQALIQKGQLTGGRIQSWQSNTINLNAAVMDAATTVAGGYVYMAGGSTDGSNAIATVYWAKFNTAGSTIVSPTPGSNGTCTNFCTSTAYQLPAARRSGSLVTYNGYLYFLGGVDSSYTSMTTVYKSKIGANGEPTTWSATSALGSVRGQLGAVAYNNKLYAIGGGDSSSFAALATTESASINPDGTISSWSASTSMPVSRMAHSVVQYNGYIYVLGGVDGTATSQSGVYYIKINADGTLASSWVATTSMPQARASTGGNFATVYSGYLYISGGCQTFATFYACSDLVNSLQLASFNADGSITNWANTGITRFVSSQGFVGWRGSLYTIGGCTNTGTFCLDTIVNTAQYGVINASGDVSTKVTSPATPATWNAPACRVTSTDCDLPVAGSNNVGRMAQGTVVNNGWIYNIGGCNRNNCSTGSISNDTARAQINSDGTLTDWTTDAQTLPAGIAAFGVTVYNNTIFTYGGSTGGGVVTSIYRSTVASNGSLGAWQTVASGTHGIGTGRAYSFVFARANPSSAGTGNLYIIGGCVPSAIGCTGYYNQVYKCTIPTNLNISGCATTSQLQLDADNVASGQQGLGIFGGTVYGNYIYLAAGASGDAGGGNTTAQTNKVYYAEIDSSNNIVDPTSGHTYWPYTTTDTAGTGTTASTLPQVRRRTYAMAVNGYLYVIAGHDGTSGGTGVTLRDVVVGKIDQQTGNILSYSRLQDSSGSTDVLAARWDLRAVSYNGYLYMIGGCTSGYPPSNCGNGGGGTSYDGMDGVVEYVQVYNNWSGSPALYSSQSTGTLLTDRHAASAVVNNGYLYVAGGCTAIVAADCSTYTNNVSYVPINANGTITSNWTSGNTLPAARAKGCMVTIGSTLYYIGGQSATTGGNSAFSNVYYSTLTAGVPGTWSAVNGGSATGQLPAVRAEMSCATYNGKIYVAGGYNATPTYYNSVAISPSLPSGGDITSAWSTSGNTFTLARSGASVVAYGNNLYVMGGFDATNYLLDVQYALINSDGTIGTWSRATSLPQSIRQGDSFAANGYMYVFGGRSASTTCTANTYVAPINANPIVNKVVQQNPSPLGSWSQTNVVYSGARHGVAAAYDGGRAYLVGGMCNGTFTNTNRVVYSTLQSQPQISRYSYMIDADNDVNPSKVLANGIDSGIGARWLLNYRSSQSSTNAWGLTTNAGVVTLGTPGTYTPLNGAGTNTQSARYYYLSYTIDASQSFGFPEDSSRGPTIDDITLQLSAAPNKRLRNGKTFTGGQQQPLDTPF